MIKSKPFLANFFNLGFIQVSNAVIQILLFPIIIRIIGLHEFGYAMVANAYAALAGLFINYGTNQSGIKDVAINKNNGKALNEIFYTVYYTRFLLFILSMIVLAGLYGFSVPHARYFLFASTIVFAEMLNPLFFFIGIEKLFLYNVANLMAKLLSALLIIVLIHANTPGWWVNFYLGLSSTVFFIPLLVYLLRQYQLTRYRISVEAMRQFLKHNFFLTGNNLFVQLQQSFFLFTLSGVVSPLVLGAYSLCDKIVWSFRLLIVSFSSAVYPRAAVLFREQKELWHSYKTTINGWLAVCFLLAAGGLLWLAPWIVTLLTGKPDTLTTLYIRSVAFVPFIAALNAMNVIDLLVKNRYSYLFTIGVILCSIAIITSFLFVKLGHENWYGYFPIIIEVCSLPLYFLFIRKTHA
ncbi:Membrane protein involved in the export of O-antigen and teichoic acid [Hydrobacter penzbergensis]|uniref:Membrane protein involved in the export of O-antigen and teichoic acid n=1 Tax=Hydrobacter penzbergensis TaxID=1235997 RepID=A0A8X8IC69_9BACT|nr:lipopolysaccharide biosynthesis protein [Hydrobacter penzbergensis]SDW84517.1 Membrane protein involved in the export of O-antigen and teichoic acid [Hydrobacter penzbergensis]